jgi:hypothetical protein
MIKIIAVLCSLSSPANCHEQIVTTSDFAEVSMQSCLMGAPQLAEWNAAAPGRTPGGMALRHRQTGWQGSLGLPAPRTGDNVHSAGQILSPHDCVSSA